MLRQPQSQACRGQRGKSAEGAARAQSRIYCSGMGLPPPLIIQPGMLAPVPRMQCYQPGVQSQGHTLVDPAADPTSQWEITFYPGLHIFAISATGEERGTFCSDLEKSRMQDSIPGGGSSRRDPRMSRTGGGHKGVRASCKGGSRQITRAVHPSHLAETDLEEGPGALHRLSTPIIIVNKSSTHQSLDRRCLLGTYRELAGLLFSEMILTTSSQERLFVQQAPGFHQQGEILALSQSPGGVPVDSMTRPQPSGHLESRFPMWWKAQAQCPSSTDSTQAWPSGSL